MWSLFRGLRPFLSTSVSHLRLQGIPHLKLEGSCGAVLSSAVSQLEAEESLRQQG